MIGDMESSSGSYNPWRGYRKRRGIIVDNIIIMSTHARNTRLTFVNFLTEELAHKSCIDLPNPLPVSKFIHRLLYKVVT